MNWLQSIPGGGGSCCKEGLMEALKYANTSSSSRKVVVYVGDGGGTCNGANETTYLTATLAAVQVWWSMVITQAAPTTAKEVAGWAILAYSAC